MSVSNQTPYKSYTAAPGATMFSTDFRVIVATDLAVKVDGVTITSGFTISGLDAPAGADVTFGVPMVGGEFVELERQVPLERLTDYQQTGRFPADVVNRDFDRLWMALQDAGFFNALAIQLPVGDTRAPMTIPGVTERASKFFAFNALGDAIAALGVPEAPTSAFMATVLDDPTAAAARATLGAAATGSISTAGITMATARMLGRTTAGTGAPEELTAAQARAFQYGTRVDVASASTVDLSAVATDDIRITGTTTIAGFTIAVGRVVRIVFSGALTLTNGANLTTNSGANIVTQAGDSCTVRATAANTVEVIGYTTAAQPFTRKFTSSGQTITLGGALALAHGLGGMPDLVQVRLRCTTAELGYSINDEMLFNLQGDYDGTTTRGLSVVPDATNVSVRFSTNGLQAVRKDNGALASLTAGNWQLVMRAWR